MNLFWFRYLDFVCQNKSYFVSVKLDQVNARTHLYKSSSGPHAEQGFSFVTAHVNVTDTEKNKERTTD